MAYDAELEDIVSELNSPAKCSVLAALRNYLESSKRSNHEVAVKWATVIEDWSWERLHSGHWEDVPICFRKVYSMAVLLKAKGLINCKRHKEALLVVDKGILMGAPIMNDQLQKMADEISHDITSIPTVKDGMKRSSPMRTAVPLKKINLEDNGTISNGRVTTGNHGYCVIQRMNCPSLEVFFTNHMKPAKPVILTGCINHWPSMGERRWSVEYIKETAGLRTVPVELGSRYTDDKWSQKLMTVKEFIESYIEIPQLHKDICIPDYCCLSLCEQPPGEGTDGEDVKINAWFGPKDTISPLHYDPQHNLLTQVVGSKYIVLFGPSDTELLYPHAGILSNTSQVDIDSPDESKYPMFRKATGFSCVLEEGEMLYIPPKWWHYVKSLSVSFSVSFWWT